LSREGFSWIFEQMALVVNVLGPMPVKSEILLIRRVLDSKANVDFWSSVCHWAWSWTHEGNWHGFTFAAKGKNHDYYQWYIQWNWKDSLHSFLIVRSKDYHCSHRHKPYNNSSLSKKPTFQIISLDGSVYLDSNKFTFFQNQSLGSFSWAQSVTSGIPYWNFLYPIIKKLVHKFCEFSHDENLYIEPDCDILYKASGGVAESEDESFPTLKFGYNLANPIPFLLFS